ncbi:MAG: hydrogenase iron-sulfur subunit [Pseudomonadota bacterium]
MSNNKPKITLFHCINSFTQTASLFDNCQIKTIKMACSSMTRDIQLLKAFEAGADAVLVLVCPEDACRYAQGSIRAKKRVEYVKTILDTIGLNGNRLNIFNTKATDSESVKRIIQETITAIETMGPNPAA